MFPASSELTTDVAKEVIMNASIGLSGWQRSLMPSRMEEEYTSPIMLLWLEIRKADILQVSGFRRQMV